MAHDIDGVTKSVEIYPAEISYVIFVHLRSLAKHAYEMGEDEQVVWEHRVPRDYDPAYHEMAIAEQNRITSIISNFV